MKIKWIVLFALSIWAIGFCLVFYSASRQQTKLVDNGKINDVQMQMIKKYLSGEERPETCMGMDILWRNQKDYKEQVNDRIVRGQSMADIMVKDQLVGKVCWDADGVDVSTDQMGISYIIIVGFLLALFGILLLSYYFYRQLVLPFRSLQRFTEHVAMGDLDFPIKMEKKNYFGAFTTSFDIMRVELKRARDSESQALQSKRELVAQLSHDVKTPISSISANCELLLLQVSNGDERKKIEVIQRKTKMIEELTSSLFQAALEEINQLKVEPKEESVTSIVAMFEEVNYYEKIHLEGEIPACMIYCDPLRLMQVIDNVITNSYKYANTDIHVTMSCDGQELLIRIQDEGDGLDKEELPLLFEKFYRGKNAQHNEGSGLGLYISRSFMNKMGGHMELAFQDGFVVYLYLPLI